IRDGAARSAGRRSRRGRQFGGRRHRLGGGGLGGCRRGGGRGGGCLSGRRRGGGLDRRRRGGGLDRRRRGGRPRRAGVRRAAARAGILPALGTTLRRGEEHTGVEGPRRRRLHATLGLCRRRRGGRPAGRGRGRRAGRGGRGGRRRGRRGATRRAARIAAARRRADERRPATRRLAGRRGALDRASRVAGGIGAAAGHGAFEAAGRLRRAGHHRVLALFPQLSLRYRLLRHHGHAVHILAVIGRAVTIALFVCQRADGSNLVGIIRLLATGFPRVDGAVVRRKLSLLWRRRA